jgi:hypothetical protein
VVVDTFVEVVLAATDAVGVGVVVLEHAAATGRTNSVTPANPIPWVFRRIRFPPAKSAAQGRISLGVQNTTRGLMEGLRRGVELVMVRDLHTIVTSLSGVAPGSA